MASLTYVLLCFHAEETVYVSERVEKSKTWLRENVNLPVE